MTSLIQFAAFCLGPNQLRRCVPPTDNTPPSMIRTVKGRFPWIALMLLGIGLAHPSRSPAQLVIQGPTSKLPQHIAVPLPAGQLLDTTANWQLVDDEDPNRQLPVQLSLARTSHGISNATQQLVLATLPAKAGGKIQKLRLVQPADAGSQDDTFQLIDDGENSLQLLEQDQPILTYNYGVVTEPSVPENDTRRSRACYIHPIWGLGGEILTDDFPRDHYHHHGVFWAWPYIKVGDATYDLWEYSNIQQRFVGWLERESGRVAARIGVENGWFVGPKQLVTERVWISTYRSEQDARAIDLSITLIAHDQPVTIQGRALKSYGGLTFRYDVTPRTDATVRVPGRKLDEDLLNTPLAWADLTSRFPDSQQRSGASVFIHPNHPDYPPAWLTRRYGALCVGWPGIETHTLQPDKPVTLNYRLWVHRSEETVETIDQVYASYRQSHSDGWKVINRTK